MEVLCTGVARLCILGVVLHLIVDLLVSFIELLLLLHQLNLLTGVLIQIELQIRLLLEILVRVWQELGILFDLFYLVKVLLKNFRTLWGSNPFGCFFNDFLYDLVLDDFFDID